MHDKDVIRGVSEGVFAFLSDRPVSVIDPAIDQISNSVAEVVRSWMNMHEDEIIEAIARGNVMTPK